MAQTIVGEGGFVQVTKTATDDIKLSADEYFKTLREGYAQANADANTYKGYLDDIVKDNEDIVKKYSDFIQLVKDSESVLLA
jgi:hypothetical protein